MDVILLEGWCVGAVSQGEAALVEPINDLERDVDRRRLARVRRNQLDGPYQFLFARLQDLVLLQASASRWWRAGGPSRRPAAGAGGGGMSEAEIGRFVAPYG